MGLKVIGGQYRNLPRLKFLEVVDQQVRFETIRMVKIRLCTFLNRLVRQILVVMIVRQIHAILFTT